MSFADLPPQPPIFPAEAEDYARRALERSAAALGQCTRIADQAYGPDPYQTVDVYPRSRPMRKAHRYWCLPMAGHGRTDTRTGWA